MNCEHPRTSRLVRDGVPWCPWCDAQAQREDHVESVRRWLQFERREHHAWAIATALHQPRSRIQSILRELFRHRAVRPVGEATILRQDNSTIKLRKWRTTWSER